jgi:hypothetical protein
MGIAISPSGDSPSIASDHCALEHWAPRRMGTQHVAGQAHLRSKSCTSSGQADLASPLGIWWRHPDCDGRAWGINRPRDNRRRTMERHPASPHDQFGPSSRRRGDGIGQLQSEAVQPGERAHSWSICHDQHVSDSCISDSCSLRRHAFDGRGGRCAKHRLGQG